MEEVSIGEINQRIISVTRANELSLLTQFKSCEGKIWKPLYFPPREVEVVEYSQNQKNELPIIREINRAISTFASKPSFTGTKTNKVISLLHCVTNDLGTKLAVCFPDNSIQIYNVVTEEWETTELKLPEQEGVHSLCWKPNSRNTLAVGCAAGVFVWSFSDCAYYRTVTNSPFILSAQYSPCGQYD